MSLSTGEPESGCAWALARVSADLIGSTTGAMPGVCTDTGATKRGDGATKGVGAPWGTGGTDAGGVAGAGAVVCSG
jgi:hypothetical protein